MPDDGPSIRLPVVGTWARPRRRALRRVGLALAALGLALAIVSIALLPIGRLPAPAGAAGSIDPAAGGPAGGVAIGALAPEFPTTGNPGTSLLTGLDGAPIRLADYAGRPLWIVFWATWCTPCQAEASDIRALYRAHRSDDLAVLAIDVRESTAVVRDFVARNGLDYPVGLDPTAAVEGLYGQLGLPGHVFVDGRGVIRDRAAGQLTRDLMEAHLATIIGPGRQP